MFDNFKLEMAKKLFSPEKIKKHLTPDVIKKAIADYSPDIIKSMKENIEKQHGEGVSVLISFKGNAMLFTVVRVVVIDKVVTTDFVYNYTINELTEMILREMNRKEVGNEINS